MNFFLIVFGAVFVIGTIESILHLFCNSYSGKVYNYKTNEYDYDIHD